jgi:hypothetical protein
LEVALRNFQEFPLAALPQDEFILYIMKKFPT